MSVGIHSGAFNPMVINKSLLAVGLSAAVAFAASLNWPVSAIAQEEKPKPQVLFTNVNIFDGKSDKLAEGHCQTNLNRPAKGAGLKHSGRQLTPRGQGGRTVLFEDTAGVEVAVMVEVVVD